MFSVIHLPLRRITGVLSPPFRLSMHSSLHQLPRLIDDRLFPP